MAAKIIILVVFALLMIGIGVFTRKNATDVNGFVLGGRSVGPWMTAFAYGTSYFSAVIFIGYAGQFGWSYGLSSTWIGIGNAIIGSMLAWIVLGNRTRIMTKHLNVSTMPEYFEKRYDSKALKIAAALIVFLFLIPYTASVYNGLSTLFNSAFPGITYTTWIIIMALFTAVYVILGGYKATAVNDFVQGIIMLIGIAAVVVCAVNNKGGLSAVYESLGQIPSGSVHGTYNSVLGPDPLNLIGVIILTSLGTWGLPQMVQKFYAIKNEKAIEKGTVISTLFAVVVAGGCYFLGGFGRLFDIDVKTLGYDAIIPKMLENLPDLLIAVVILLVLSASMSTLSSLVLTSSSTLTIDIIKPASKKMTERTQLSVMRVLIAVFIIISAVLAFVQYKLNISSIAQLMGISWGALAGAFLAPFIYGLYWKRATAAGCAASFVFGVGVMTANMIFRSYFPAILRSPVNCGAFVMLAGLVIVPVVSLLTKSPDRAKTDEMFSCYDTAVTGQAKEFLGD